MHGKRKCPVAENTEQKVVAEPVVEDAVAENKKSVVLNTKAVKAAKKAKKAEEALRLIHVAKAATAAVRHLMAEEQLRAKATSKAVKAAERAKVAEEALRAKAELRAAKAKEKEELTRERLSFHDTVNDLVREVQEIHNESNFDKRVRLAFSRNKKRKSRMTDSKEEKKDGKMDNAEEKQTPLSNEEAIEELDCNMLMVIEKQNLNFEAKPTKDRSWKVQKGKCAHCGATLKRKNEKACDAPACQRVRNYQKQKTWFAKHTSE